MAVKPIRTGVFPAAGLGTRFLPATKALPKEMLPLVDKPLIQYVVEEAIASGVSNIIIVSSRGKSAIEDHFDIAFELESTLEKRGKTDQLIGRAGSLENGRRRLCQTKGTAWDLDTQFSSVSGSSPVSHSPYCSAMTS